MESYIRGESWLRLRSLEGKDVNCLWNGLDCAEAAVIGRLGWKKSLSSAFAGDGEQLLGMGSKPNPFSVGLDGRMVSRTCDETADVSHELKPSS